MKLIVGPGDSRQERVDDARAAWDAFESELGTPVFPYSSLELRALYRSVGNAVACAYPKIGPRYGTTEHVQMILGEKFSQETAERQTLTLVNSPECRPEPQPGEGR